MEEDILFLKKMKVIKLINDVFPFPTQQGRRHETTRALITDVAPWIELIELQFVIAKKNVGVNV